MASYVPKNILVTGAAGFIGSNFVLKLAQNPDYKVVWNRCHRPASGQGLFVAHLLTPLVGTCPGGGSR
jgi:nucleoside-diphosphate-sugar epimerase